jgi:hypothetical protein
VPGSTPAFDDPNSITNITARGNTYAFGTLTRVDGAARMGPYLSEDFNLLKRTKITESSDMLLQVNALNAFNRHVWNRPGDLGPADPAFALINYFSFSSTGGGGYLLFPRRLQLQLKFEF